MLGLLAVLLALWAAFAGPARAAAAPDRYDIVHGCFALKPAAGGQFVAQTGNGYSASSGSIGGAEPFRMQATDLGSYLFYGQAEDFLGLDPGPLANDAVIAATEPSGRADWEVKGEGGVFEIVNEATDLGIAVGNGGEIVSVPKGQADAFSFNETSGCADYPEVELNTTGEPTEGSPGYGEVTGLVDAHMHMMAFEFLGGQAHCGQPWDKFGAPHALQDCEDHTASNGCAAVLETFLGGNACHDPVGWPTFNDWPDPHSLTHESSYYKWLERAHEGGLRVFTNLLVENRVLCEVYPLQPLQPGGKNSCNEMDSVLLQAKRLNQLQDYIDAQEGGPGEGWFRIVRNPFRARRVINQGKLAVVMGMEVSEPFDCRLRGGPAQTPPDAPPTNRVDPRCTEEGISRWLRDLKKLGVRQLELTNKFDNALTGVAGDGGSTGVVINNGQFGFVGGEYWDFGPYKATCDEDNHDRVPSTGGSPVSQDEIFGNGLAQFGIPTLLQLYGPDDKCNQLGLSDLGRYAIRGAIKRNMIFDPDHMSEYARGQALDLVENRDYSGIVSSHSWSTSSTLPRVYGLGGVVTPYAGNSTSFASEYEHLKDPAIRSKLGDQYFGVGYGADGNGFGSQGEPRGAGVPNPVTYPFDSFDGNVTFEKQVSGERVYDINRDGVAHYGLYPDWIEDLRQIKGDGIVADMGRGAEAYLQMWERAYGVPEVDCSRWDRIDFDQRGLGAGLRLNRKPKLALRQAGQPVRRSKVWRYCGGNRRNSEKSVKAVFSNQVRIDFILSNLRQHRIRGVGPGAPKRRLRRVGEHLSGPVWISRNVQRTAYVWIVGDNGRVSHVGTVSRYFAHKPVRRMARKLTRIAAN